MTIIPDHIQGGEPLATADAEVSDTLLTSGEAATALNVAPQTITRWADDGTLPPAGRTPGGHRRFRSSVVHALRARLYGGGQ